MVASKPKHLTLLRNKIHESNRHYFNKDDEVRFTYRCGQGGRVKIQASGGMRFYLETYSQIGPLIKYHDKYFLKLYKGNRPNCNHLVKFELRSPILNGNAIVRTVVFKRGTTTKNLWISYEELKNLQGAYNTDIKLVGKLTVRLLDPSIVNFHDD